jgi:PEP-CTERM motif
MTILKSAARTGLLMLLTASLFFGMDGVTQTETPEPGTVALVAIGFAAGAYAMYRSRRNRP